MGIVGFLMLGRTGKIAIVGILGLLKAIGVDLDAITNKVFGGTKKTEEFGAAFKSVNEFIKKIEENIILSKEQLAELQKELKGIEQSSEKTLISFSKIQDSIKNQIKKDLESINDTIGKFILSGVKGFSRSLAEAVVLGKELNKSFKELAQKLLVEALAFTIQMVIQEQIKNILSKDTLETEKKKTGEMKKQLQFQSAMMLMSGNPLGFLGFTAMANGGAVRKGQPLLVGERGAEMFIPNSTGQITQAARGTGGRSAVVNFNINTIDSRGFDQALLENRATITSIINNALTEKGRGELI